MIVTILGSGTSTGVPLILCPCHVCQSKDSKNKRLRCSIWIQHESKHFLVDTSPDLRQQALQAGIPRIDAVLFTHPHADHIHGIDELRGFTFVQKSPIPVFGNAWTCKELKAKFSYIFNPTIVEGGGIPRLDLHCFDANAPFIEILGEKLIPLSLSHGSKESVGFRLNSFAYVTDCNFISDETRGRMRDLSVLVLDCVQLQPHGTHLNLEQALMIISDLRPKKTFLTHLGHQFDYEEWSKKLPKGVNLAYDGLTINTL